MNQEELDIRLLQHWQGEPLFPGEEAEIRAWLDASEEHELYYEELKRDYLRQRWVMREGLIGRKGERRYRQVARRKVLVKWVTTVAASLLLLVGVGYYGWQVEVEPEQVVVVNDIHVGSAKAKLYLSSGDEIALEKENMAIRERQDVAIRVNESGVVAYQDTAVAMTEREMAYNRLVVNRGGEYRIVLSDGSEVWVNSESELVYPILFVGDKRIVKLRGEAYFKVRADAERPFIVDVDGVEVRAVGTEFCVNTRKENKVESVLVEGKVNVRKGDDGVMLEPNQLAVYDVRTNRIEVKNVDVRKYIDWKNGDFVFSDDRLEEVMDKLSLWYDCKVFYQNADLKDVRLSGDMKRYGEVEEFLHFLEISTGARFEVQGKTIIVGSK